MRIITHRAALFADKLSEQADENFESASRPYEPSIFVNLLLDSLV